MAVTARKRFGQHFLHEPAAIRRILEAVSPRPGEVVVEIGPGRGALTAALLERLTELHAIELDRDLAAYLRRRFPRGLVLHEGDALDFDYRALAAAGPLRLVGNLPYNISTALLLGLLEDADILRDMHFMLQREVAERLSASPGGRAYGRLSVMVQWRCRVERLFTLGPGAFQPPPKVDSTVLRLTPRADAPAVGDPRRFAELVRLAFGQRRKSLRNALRGRVPEAVLARAGIDPGRRAETLAVEEFARLARLAGGPATR